jgi:hypothetical protein
MSLGWRSYLLAAASFAHSQNFAAAGLSRPFVATIPLDHIRTADRKQGQRVCSLQANGLVWLRTRYRPELLPYLVLTPTSDGCSVVTDEVGIGKDAAHLRETDESLMHRGHDLWLATLKWMSEGR